MNDFDILRRVSKQNVNIRLLEEYRLAVYISRWLQIMRMLLYEYDAPLFDFSSN